jgi:hypothetical protein
MKKPPLRAAIDCEFTENLGDETHQFFQFPYMIRQSGFHRGRDAEGLVNAAEVVVHEVKRNVVLVVLPLL